MTDPRTLSIEDYTYTLPEEKIARYPLAVRDDSRLLVYQEGNISTDIYRNLPAHLPENTLLILNNTRVLEARLLFRKPSGGIIEIFCLEPHERYADMTTAMMQKETVQWQCLVGGASKWKKGQLLEKKIRQHEQEIVLTAGYAEKRQGSLIIELSWSPASLSFAEVLHAAGAVPLPPYMKRPAEESDTERYQTVYARFDGSVAAPTAGLHFTENIFRKLSRKKIETDFITLHVGAGTFKPVKSETMSAHDMHAEWMDVSKKTLEYIAGNTGKNIVAVGTTSLRAIESLYWLGVKQLTAAPGRTMETNPPSSLLQWEAYELAERNIPVRDALQGLLNGMEKNKTERLVTRTQLLIAPGYPFKIVNGLITNFHQPRSTLLLLVAALVGQDWKKIYAYAGQHDFRFLSYGDGCLLWRNPEEDGARALNFSSKAGQP